MDILQEIDLMEIDPWKLPSVEIENRELLPDSNGIYFVIKGRRVLYIGKTEDGLKSRWSRHHRYEQLSSYGNTKIAYWEVTGIDYLAIEADLIRLFNPEFNRTPTSKDELRAKYEETLLALERQKTKAVVDETSRKLILLSSSILTDAMFISALAKVSDPINPEQTGMKIEDFGKTVNEIGGSLEEVVKEYNKLRSTVKSYYRAVQEFTN